MGKLYEFLGQRGSNLDWISKVEGTATDVRYADSEKGMTAVFNGSTSKIDFGEITLSRNSAAINIWFNNWNSNSNGSKLIGNDVSGYKAVYKFSSSYTRLESNTDGDIWLNYNNSIDNNWHNLIVVANGGTVTTYFDSNLVETRTPSDDVTFRCIGAYVSGDNWKGNIGRVTFWDTPLTISQINTLYSEFQHSFPVVETKRNFVYPKPLDLSNEDGLVGAYNMIPQNGELVDISGNGNTGTVYGAQQVVDGMYFDGVDNYVQLSSDVTLSKDNATLCVRMKGVGTAGTTRTIIGNSITNGYYRIVFTTSAQIYVEGLNADIAQTTNSVQTVGDTDYVITFDGGIVSVFQDGVQLIMSDDTLNSDLVFNRIGATQNTNYIDTEFIDLRVYNRVLTLNEIEDYHNQFAERIYLRDTFSDQGVGTTLPTGWQQISGSFEVNELAAADSVLSDIRIGYKYLECKTAGAIYIQSEQAYGEWVFDFYKNTGSIQFYLIQNTNGIDSNQGYNILISSNRYISFQVKGISTLFQTVNAYIENSVNYRIKVTRDVNGKFYVYVKGGSFGEKYQIVDPTGGTGTNPVTNNTFTTSKYKVIDLDAGDRIGSDPSFQGVKTINENMTLAGYLPLTQ